MTDGRITPGRISTMCGADRPIAATAFSSGLRRTRSSRRIAVMPSWRIAGISWPCELMTASTPALASQPTLDRSARRPPTRSTWTATSLPASWILPNDLPECKAVAAEDEDDRRPADERGPDVLLGGDGRAAWIGGDTAR